MAAAKITQQKDGDVLAVTVSGYLGENAQLFDLNLLGIKKVIINLRDVNYMNSIGVKNWINWTSRFPKGLIIHLINCPTLIVNQVNMVAGFLRDDGSIESLLAPFTCDNDSREEFVLLTRGVHYQYAIVQDGLTTINLPEVKCPKCGTPMELDTIPAKFFNFLKTVHKPA